LLLAVVGLGWGRGECVARRSDCSVAVHPRGVRRSHRPGILGTVGASLLAPAAVEVLVTAAGSLLQLLVE